MYIVVVGLGKVGQLLTQYLSKEDMMSLLLIIIDKKLKILLINMMF